MSKMKEPNTPTGELRDVDVKFVSLVSKAANKRKFAIFKSAGFEDGKTPELESEETKQAVGFFKLVKEFFTGSEKQTIEKADTTTPVVVPDFSTTLKVEQIQMWKLWDAISEVFWNLVRNDVVNKRAVLEQSLLQFNAEVLKNFDTLTALQIVKGEDGKVEIEKSGRKISASRLQALRDARTHLDTVISDAEAQPETVDDGTTTTAVEKGEEIDMKPEELQAAIAKALEPITEKLTKLEKGETEEPATGEITPESITKAVQDALKPLEGRIAKMETARGMSNQDLGDDDEGDDQDTQRQEMKKSGVPDWGGLFLTR